MKKWLLIFFLLPLLVTAQRKSKKEKLAEAKARQELVYNLKKHIQFLADDKLEGRRTGTAGELLAMQYISEQYKQMGLEPRGSNGYVQEFQINEGKQIDAATFLQVNDKKVELNTYFFPLAYSYNKNAKGNVAATLNESGQPWFIDLKDVLEENQNNPHFDIDEFIKKETEKIASKSATALLLYNSSSKVDNVQFNKNDTTSATKIPVLYLNKEGFAKYFSDATATVNLSLNVSLSDKKRFARNVVGFINNNANTTVVLGAHYDHLGYGEDKNALDTGHVIHNGADDNASGIAALIELTRLLKQSSPKHNNYLILNFSGEELGILGSKYWLDHPTTNITANYMINMDMVGRYDTSHKLTIGGYGTSPYWGELFQTTTDKNLMVKYDSAGSGPSDHEAFYRKDIPVLFFFTGSHSDYHKASDDWEKINYDGEAEIVQYIYQLINAADAKNKLAFTKTREPQAGRSTKFTVSLGVIPDYGFSGTGVRIDGVSGGKLAEKIGLQAGDILLQLGDYKFVDVMSYMQTLSKFKKGDKVKLKTKRGGTDKEYDVEF
jgi:hypothetical protein